MLATIGREALIERSYQAHLDDDRVRSAGAVDHYARYLAQVVGAGVSAGAEVARAIEADTQEAVFRALDERDAAVFDLHEREEAGYFATEDGLGVLRAVADLLDRMPAPDVRDLLEGLTCPAVALNVLAALPAPTR